MGKKKEVLAQSKKEKRLLSHQVDTSEATALYNVLSTSFSRFEPRK
jgi:hypothetical protein